MQTQLWERHLARCTHQSSRYLLETKYNQVAGVWQLGSCGTPGAAPTPHVTTGALYKLQHSSIKIQWQCALVYTTEHVQP